MYYTAVLNLILIICWMASCIYCYNAGVKYKNQREKAKRIKPKEQSEAQRKAQIKYLRELENLLTYDGSVQE